MTGAKRQGQATETWGNMCFYLKGAITVFWWGTNILTSITIKESRVWTLVPTSNMVHYSAVIKGSEKNGLTSFFFLCQWQYIVINCILSFVPVQFLSVGLTILVLFTVFASTGVKHIRHIHFCSLAASWQMLGSTAHYEVSLTATTINYGKLNSHSHAFSYTCRTRSTFNSRCKNPSEKATSEGLSHRLKEEEKEREM